MRVTLLVYGAYGYTGELVAREAVERGLDPVVGGRDRTEIQHLAAHLDCEGRAFTVTGATPHLADVDCLLNCAGPFVRTADRFVDACLETGTDYLDITGEIEVFESLAGRDEDAERAGLTVLPGVGFDVVPTDCLAAHLVERLPEATHLALGFDDLGTVSPGTAASAVGVLGEGGAVRRQGRIKRVRPAWKTRRIDFGEGVVTAVTVPWGDVATAYHTTGVENVEVYAGVPAGAIPAMRASRFVAPLLGLPPVAGSLEGLARSLAEGPDAEEREETRCNVWGEARVDASSVDETDARRRRGCGSGRCGTGGSERVVSRLRTPNTYALTVDSAVTAAERTLAGDAPDGYATPAGAFGSEFVTELADVEGFRD